MVNQNLEATLKRAQKKAADTNPEIYRDKVLSAARQAMDTAKEDSIEIDHKKGKVIFSLDRNSDKIRMFVNDEEISEEKIAATIADLDGIGKPKNVVDKVQNAAKASGFTRRHGDMVFYGALRSAKAGLKESNRTASTILGALLRIVGKTISAR